MAQEPYRYRRPRHISPGKKLLLLLALLGTLAVCSTLFLDLSAMEDASLAAQDPSEWTDAVDAFIVAEEGSLTAPFYNEGLAVVGEYGRGSRILLESWEPFVAENGVEYYHASLDGQVGYIRCQNVTDDNSEFMQETQLYVRSSVNLLKESRGTELGPLAQKGTLLRIVSYDYFKPDGSVHMYNVKIGDEMGWIKSDYVALDYSDSMDNWTNEYGSYDDHKLRGDEHGGGDAASLDYWPHEKGDFADQGNAMPQDVYAMYIPVTHVTPDIVQEYLDLARSTAINAFVITLNDGDKLAYPSRVYDQYGLLSSFSCVDSAQQFSEAMGMLKDAGYYLIARISTFQDSPIAKAKPEWSISDWSGLATMLDDRYWLSPYCRNVWQMKVEFGVELADEYGFNEIQFDNVCFPNFTVDDEKNGVIDMRNGYHEERAQALQRFLTYASDVLHEYNAYVAVDLFGETSNPYVAPCGQYWPAMSNVVDVICGKPFPDYYSSYWLNAEWIVPYRRPYQTLNTWGIQINERQRECASPAVVRTWIQTWDDYSYRYDALAIQRQIVALYDVPVTGGYMLWHEYGSLYVSEDLAGAVEQDYRALYEQAKAQDKSLSKFMGLSTTDK